MGYLTLSENEGASFWQPEPANGYVDIKVSQKVLPGCPFSMGTQTIPPGSFVREHSHAAQYESIVVLEGSGTAVIEGQRFPMRVGSTFAIAPHVPHGFHNDGHSDLKFQWTISPGGLEEFFEAIGLPRRPGESAPEFFTRPESEAIDARHQMQASARENF